MLGDGIVSFGVWPSLATDCRNVNGRSKIVSDTPSLPSMCSAAGVNSMSPSALWNFTDRLPGRLGDPVERVDEVHVPGGAAELAVGDRLQPGLLLHADDVPDRLVLGLREALVVEPAGGVRLARLEQLGRPQQAADVVGAERRTGSLGHSLSSRRVRERQYTARNRFTIRYCAQ